MMRPVAIFASLAVLSQAAAAAGVPESPSLKPDRPYTSSVTDARNAEILHKALRAADRYDWPTVAHLQTQASDADVRNLIMWIRASRGVPSMNFSEVSFALDKLQDWPKTTSMRRRAEEIIGESSFSHKERIDWLTESGPITGAGKIALADSWRAIGEPGKALEAVRDAWHNNSLERDVEREVLSTYGKQLTQDDHRARVEFLLWTNQRTAASKLKYLLTSDYRKLVDARIALAARSRNVDALVDAVPANLQDNPGLLYERAKWRRQKLRNQDVATPLLTGIDGNDIPEAGRSPVGRTQHRHPDRPEGRQLEPRLPAGLTAWHGKRRRLRRGRMGVGLDRPAPKNDADRSLQHFETMSDGVSTPISLARGKYWAGRARDALGQPDAARTDYTAAAEHKFTYYGQLAAERLDDKKLAFPKTSEPTAEEISAFEDKPMVQALRLLGESGEERLFREFAYHMDDLLETESEYLLLARIATEYQVPDVGVRGAKAGLAKGIVSTDAAYPVVAYPLLREPQVERPLMLALSRQESEMNPNAISHVGARGLMQFMPATARNEARLRGLPYRTSWLTDDPGYNMTLGGQHLDTLLSRFNGSYIMTAAAYNAGPSRPRQWIQDYGDPRTGQVDPIDWVEFIPFSETRNYVQRVLENTQVYRHRLSGEPIDIEIEEDLDRGRE